MPQTDYILRLIERFGAALAAIRKMLAAGAAPETVRRELQSAARGVGVDFEMASIASEGTLAAVLSAGEEVNPSRCWMTAELLLMDGEAATAAGEHAAALVSYRKARLLFSLLEPGGVFLVGWPEAGQRVRDLDDRLARLEGGG